MNITLQSILNVSRNNVMNIKSRKKNDESSFFVTVLNSLQNSWKFFLHMLIEVERSLKRRCEKNTKIGTSRRWSTLVFFKEIQKQSQKNQSNAYLQLTVQKHLDQMNKMRTVEYLYSMLLIFIETFEFLLNQTDSQAQF